MGSVEVASTASDFSRLSVSADPSPSMLEVEWDDEEPINFDDLSVGSISYTCESVDFKFDGSYANVPHHEHVIVVYSGNQFTVNGGAERDMSHPSNAKFLESVKNYQIPEELAAYGLHTIRVIKTFKSLNDVKVVRDESFDEHHRLMMGM